MTPLETLLSSRLENLRPASDGGYVAACPICRLEGHDAQRDHLKIYRSSAFVCFKHQGDTAHNRAIRAFIYTNADEATLLQLSIAVIDPEPRPNIDPVYPEALLGKLVPDYRYWANRGVSEEVLRRLEGGMYPSDMRGKMEGRFVFPVRHHITGRIMGWTGRLVSDASFGPTWKHLVRTSRCVYPLTANREFIQAVGQVILVESLGDAMSLMTHGVSNVLILLGLQINSELLGYLISANLARGVVISTNNDAIGGKANNAAGNRAADKLRAKLVPYLGENKVRIRLPESHKDWGGATVEEIGVFRGELAAHE